MPPLKGRALVDELCFKLPTYLQEQLGVTQIQVDARAGCTAADLDGFERNTGYALPADLRAFLAVSNGLKCDWAVDVKTRGPADVGALRLHRLDDIVPVTLDDDEADDAGARARTFRRDDAEGLGRVERAFELDRSARIGRVPLLSEGRVCLVYRADRRAAPEVWFQDLACGWHYLAPSFTCYFRLAVAHLGVRGWQGCYAPCGADPVARQWMRLYCPERLHANDRAAEAAEAGG